MDPTPENSDACLGLSTAFGNLSTWLSVRAQDLSAHTLVCQPNLGTAVFKRIHYTASCGSGHVCIAHAIACCKYRQNYMQGMPRDVLCGL